MRIGASLLTVATGAVALIVSCSRPSGRSTEAFCAQIGVVRDLDQALAGGDPARAREQADELRQLQSAAPEELEPQVGRLAALTQEIVDQLGITTDPDLAANQVFSRHQADLADLTAAGQAVEHFASEQCQLVLNPTGGAPLAAPVTPVPPSETTTTRAPASTSRRSTSTVKKPTSRPPTTRSTTRSTSARTTTVTTKH